MSGWIGDARVGQSMEATTRHTMDSLRVLHERSASSTTRTRTWTDLNVSSDHAPRVSPQAVAGAFRQARMEAIVQDGMPQGAYEFQFTLSDREAPRLRGVPARPAPAVHRREIPAGGVDGAARRTQRRGKKFATQRLRNDVMKHVNDIAEKYLNPRARRRTPR